MYPKRIKKYQNPAGPISSDVYNTPKDLTKINKFNSGFQFATTAGTIGLSAYQSKNPTKTNDLGIGTQNSNEATLQGGLKGASMGASLGSVAGPVGTAIGGAVGLVGGAVAGYVNNQKELKANKELTASYRKDQRFSLDSLYKQNTVTLNEEAKRQRSLIPSNYRMFSAKKGGIFPKLQKGGVTPHAVIPSGPLHSEKNNLGTKGLPVVHSDTNEKKAEVEREEIIFTKPQTDFIMKYHNELKTNPTDQDYEEFGKLVGIFIDGAKDMNDE